ncbi:AI-2E family transporter [Cohnella sp. CIP 111063]|uniref:AI-2E family transporter n=1 Tax=unclassified Cohnella TaxID=2636738 RepID=UPI000B8C19B8|nr:MULTISPECIES: AI-2E family transporter [unclassified Cohnella]OXS59932.1 AI-2E family transporter [Cohnella sp. CIP 111063]PRX72742.1 putative PurR-regulated permease PerM [Cohnella sp. SGD-V74]
MHSARKLSDGIKGLIDRKFVLFLFVILLIGLNIFILEKISYIFHPFIVVLETVFLPFLLTGVAYYLLNPIVDFLEHRKVKRVYSIFGLYLVILTVLTLIIMKVVPLLSEQIASLISQFPTYTHNAQQKFEELIGNEYFNELQSMLGIDTAKLADEFSSRVSTILSNAWSGIGGVVGKITETVLAIITVPFVLFYLLKDRKKLVPFVLGFVPTRLRGRSFGVMLEMNHQISSYIRGQIIVSACIGVLLYIGYLIIGLDYSLVLAVIAACTSIVPYLGPAIAITPALIVAMMTSPIMLIKMIVIWTIVQLIEGKFISPQIMGKTMRVHPITIIFVIIAAGNLFGMIGIILAVPGYAILKVISTHLFRWFKGRTGLYDAASPAPAPGDDPAPSAEPAEPAAPASRGTTDSAE